MTPQHEYRILIVDDQRELARVLRTSLELQNQGYLITDVPSGEEALLEIQRVPFDLMVVDYRLPGMSGAELIQRARRRLPNLKCIVITGQNLEEVEEALGATGIVGIFEKPIDMPVFTATVNNTLLSEAQAEEASPATQADALNLPDFDREAAAEALDRLMDEIAPRAVALVSRAGNILLTVGILEESLRFSELAVLLANNFTTTAELSTYLGDGTSNAMHYYSGSWHDIYALSVGLHLFLVVVFPGGSQKQMGAVLRFGRPAAERIRALTAGDDAALAPTTRKPSQPSVGAERETEPTEASEEPVVGGAVVFAELVEEQQPASSVELDFDDLDAELDRMAGDLDEFWQQAASDETAAGADSISIDEAIELGLVPKDLDEQ